jgi:hypothetical protein
VGQGGGGKIVKVGGIIKRICGIALAHVGVLIAIDPDEGNCLRGGAGGRGRGRNLDGESGGRRGLYPSALVEGPPAGRARAASRPCAGQVCWPAVQLRGSASWS